MAEAMRVALLARPGTACEKLQAALQQAGADLVQVVDPTAGDVEALVAADPGAVLVALEPAVEGSLGGYDAILHDPARIVIYDEAELAAQREGWASARWVRHLAAKLGGHSDVLPPGGEEDLQPASVVGTRPAAASDPGPEPTIAPEPEPEPQAEPEPEPEAWSAVHAEPEPEPEPEPTFEPGLAWEPELSAEPSPAAGGRGVTIEYSDPGLGSTLSLVDDDAPVAATGTAGAAPEQEPQQEPQPVEAKATGGVVVLSGIGGPDAVRQFLGALPSGLPRPVLVRQRLDGGRHDRLVRQLQRATSLPVELAAPGVRLAPGHVYILPDGLSAEVSSTGAGFVESGAVDALAGLPAADSAVLLLSGADTSQVDEVMDLVAAGTLVAGQSPEECFDNAAPGAAIARGAESGSPAQLAERVATRWNA